jgi:hypothetical protein
LLFDKSDTDLVTVDPTVFFSTTVSSSSSSLSSCGALFLSHILNVLQLLKRSQKIINYKFISNSKISLRELTRESAYFSFSSREDIIIFDLYALVLKDSLKEIIL